MQGIFQSFIIYMPFDLLCNLLDSCTVYFLSKCEWNTKKNAVCQCWLVNKGNPLPTAKPGSFSSSNCSGWMPAACLDGWEFTINQVQTSTGTTRKWRRQRRRSIWSSSKNPKLFALIGGNKCCCGVALCHLRLPFAGDVDVEADVGVFTPTFSILARIPSQSIPRRAEQIWRRLVMCLQVCELLSLSSSGRSSTDSEAPPDLGQHLGAQSQPAFHYQ